MKKSHGIFLGLTALGCCSAGVYFLDLVLDRAMFPNRARLREMKNQCMQLNPGVGIEELIQLFGAPDEHIRQAGRESYSFDPYDEYSALYSDSISAGVNEKGQVTSLRCGENLFPWRQDWNWGAASGA